jgi:hypothetical protein
LISGQKLAVVLPAYNCARTLERTVRDLPDEVDTRILVDDGSVDDTVQIARALGLLVFAHDANYGYGRNQMTCYREALREGADIVVMVHPDYQYDPRLVMAMAGMVASGVYDVVLGSRILGGPARAGGMPGYKYLANRMLTVVQNAALGAKLSEYHTGYRAFRRQVLETLPLVENSDDFVFDNQMLVQALYFGFRIGEISCPTKYFPEASSINLRRSLRYGVGVLATTMQCALQRRHFLRCKIFDVHGRRLDPTAALSPAAPLAHSGRPPENRAASAVSTRTLIMHGALAALCLLIGETTALVSPYQLSIDAISYLDIADAWARCDWNHAINGYFSPLYSWILAVVAAVLRPAPEQEFLLFRIVNFAIYVAALASFIYLLQGFVARRREQPVATALPEWMWIGGGYLLFLWSTLRWVSLRSDTPDLFAATCVYLAGGVLVRAGNAPLTIARSACVGFAAALAYLAKTAMLPVGLGLVLVASLTGSLRRGTWRRLAASAACFVALSGPFIGALSHQKHRPTIGEAGRLNYAWLVNPGGYAIPVQHWQGGPAGFGWPTHRSRMVWQEPEAFEFSAGMRGTFPPWTDPSYWFDGLRWRFSWGEQLRVMRRNVAFYRGLFLDGLLIGYLLLAVVGHPLRSGYISVRDHWRLLVPAAIGLVVYLLCTDLTKSNIATQPSTRYVAPFVVLLIPSAVAGVRLRRTSRPLAVGVLRAVMMLGLGQVVARTAGDFTLVGAADPQGAQLRVASALAQLGMAPGDWVAIVGREHEHEVGARIRRARIVAQVPDRVAFSRTAFEIPLREALTRTGARWLISPIKPPASEGDGSP